MCVDHYLFPANSYLYSTCTCTVHVHTPCTHFICTLTSQMSDVKRLPERLECMLFRMRFDEELSELQPVSSVLFTLIPPTLYFTAMYMCMYIFVFFSSQGISAVTSACREMRTSKKFTKLLEVCSPCMVGRKDLLPPICTHAQLCMY